MPIVRRTLADIDLTKIEWRRDPPSDEEIDAQIAADPDTGPVWTDEDFKNAIRVPPMFNADNVRAIRQALGLTQEAFARRFGFSVETVRNYEQGHRHPTGPARVLLHVIAHEPDAVTRALAVPPTSTDKPNKA